MMSRGCEMNIGNGCDAQYLLKNLGETEQRTSIDLHQLFMVITSAILDFASHSLVLSSSLKTMRRLLLQPSLKRADGRR